MKEYGSYLQWPLANNKYNGKYNPMYFMSGRVAIKTAFSTIRQKYPYQYIVVYIPDNNCESITNAIHSGLDSNYILVPINKNLIANKVASWSRSSSIVVVYDINYLGIVNPIIDPNHTYRNVVIVQDYTHTLYTQNLYGDICIASYRKSLPSPYGAVLWYNTFSKIKLAKYVSRYSTWSSIAQYWFLTICKLLAMLAKSLSLSLFLSPFLLKIRAYIFKNPVIHIPVGKCIWYPLLQWCETKLDNVNYMGYDIVSYMFYKWYYNPLDKVSRENRRDTFIRYLTILNNKKLNLQIVDNMEGADFAIPVQMPNISVCKTVRKRLAKMYNIYCASYWGEKDILFIPNDNRLSDYDMIYMAKMLRRTIAELD